MDQRWDEAVAAIGSRSSSATGSTRRMQTAGARDQAAATGSTRTMQTAGYQGGSTTNATGSPNHMQTAGPQGGSTMCWPSRTTADIVAVPSPFVKNDGSASEHVEAELAFFMVVHCWSVWASPLQLTTPSSITWWHRVHVCRRLNCGTPTMILRHAGDTYRQQDSGNRRGGHQRHILPC